MASFTSVIDPRPFTYRLSVLSCDKRNGRAISVAAPEAATSHIVHWASPWASRYGLPDAWTAGGGAPAAGTAMERGSRATN